MNMYMSNIFLYNVIMFVSNFFIIPPPKVASTCNRFSILLHEYFSHGCLDNQACDVNINSLLCFETKLVFIRESFMSGCRFSSTDDCCNYYL